MKKLLVFCVLVGMLAGCDSSAFLHSDSADRAFSRREVGSKEANLTVFYAFDFGKGFGREEYEVLLTDDVTVMGGLEILDANGGLDVVTQTFEFGAMVEAIKGVSNSETHAWIYSVDGHAATVGADVYELSDGQVVEWRYEKF